MLNGAKEYAMIICVTADALLIDDVARKKQWQRRVLVTWRRIPSKQRVNRRWGFMLFSCQEMMRHQKQWIRKRASRKPQSEVSPADSDVLVCAIEPSKLSKKTTKVVAIYQICHTWRVFETLWFLEDWMNFETWELCPWLAWGCLGGHFLNHDDEGALGHGSDTPLFIYFFYKKKPLQGLQCVTMPRESWHGIKTTTTSFSLDCKTAVGATVAPVVDYASNV